MMESQNPEPDADERPNSLTRRTVLKVAGSTAVGIGAISGTASAHKSQFFGCSQVCTGTDENSAVIWTDSGYECRRLDKQNPDQYSTRGNITWGGQFACLEVGKDEAIVGVIHSDSDHLLCVNPNNCASNYYESEEQLVERVENACGYELEIDGNCKVFTSNGGAPNGNGRPESRDA